MIKPWSALCFLSFWRFRWLSLASLAPRRPMACKVRHEPSPLQPMIPALRPVPTTTDRSCRPAVSAPRFAIQRWWRFCRRFCCLWNKSTGRNQLRSRCTSPTFVRLPRSPLLASDASKDRRVRRYLSAELGRCGTCTANSRPLIALAAAQATVRRECVRSEHGAGSEDEATTDRMPTHQRRNGTRTGEFIMVANDERSIS
jgi:hypothetical protein